ncbi:hypothetical protein [Azospirillum picis]|uniref:AMIN domain-containing protein n=1 Tax=Azospirillum picis TaxID=488438 RepID=A0ABU0MTZ4_9PROT|nr:hypothetical protein [Azospirillum picis]MBP2303227.1 hypothetical protein [Azospirillum picis]MDQ0536966.1 hypothetical protein [Azospirillum picis]
MLRLLLLLLTPLWLSLAVDRLGLVPTLPASLSGWRRASTADTTVAPPSSWYEKGYLAANPDVAAAVRNGEITSGYTHYVQFGRAEGRGGGLPGDHPSPRPPAAAAAPTLSAVPPAVIPTVPPPVPAARVETADAAEPPLPAVKPSPAPARPPQRAGDDSKPLQATPARPTVQQVQRIRTAHSEAGVRVVLDLDQPPRFQAAVARPGGRVMVPLPGTRWLAPPSGSLFPSALEYRLEQSGADSHLVFGLTGMKGTVRLLGLSTLPPDKERGHRLVIDLALPATSR